MQADTEGAAPAQVSATEVARFDALAAQWWNPQGPMRPLHQMNPLRIGWVAAQVARHFPGRTPATLRLLDLGCGAGLAAEALARSGFDVLGVDAAPAAIAAARAHADRQGLRLAYRVGLAEALLAEGLRFPVITALEVIEHVPDPAAFLRLLAGLLEPRGLLVVSTLNRTRAAWLVAKFGAEYVLRVLPRGMHDWAQFITPAELGALGRGAGLRLADTAGMRYRPIAGQWVASRDLSINYIAALLRD